MYCIVYAYLIMWKSVQLRRAGKYWRDCLVLTLPLCFIVTQRGVPGSHATRWHAPTGAGVTCRVCFPVCRLVSVTWPHSLAPPVTRVSSATRIVQNHETHKGAESTTERLQACTIASRPIRFGCCEDCWNLIGLKAIVRACSLSVVLFIPMWTVLWS